MTTSYDRRIINHRHLLAFKDDIKSDNLWYYDFSPSPLYGWRKVDQLEMLPYDLALYQFVDEKKEDPEGKRCAMTCLDSYRLCESDKNPNMELNNKWRESIQVHVKVKFYTHV
jgi:hypothetical protein